jgi:hypothetical protein
MSTEIIEVPLALRTRFPNGQATHRFAGLPLTGLVRQLLEGVVVMCSSGGTIKSRWTAQVMAARLRLAVRRLDARGFTGGIGDLRAGDLVAVCATEDVETVLRPALRAYDELHPGRLHVSVRRFLDGRWLSRPRRSEPVRPYSKDEEEQIRRACRASIVAVEDRVAQARAEAATGGEYGPKTVSSPAHLLWTLEREGPLSLDEVGRRLGRSMYYYQSVPDAPRPSRLARRLWPGAVDLIAFRTLLGLETGIVPEGIANLRVDDLQRVDGREVIIGWEKQRGGGREADRFAGGGEWSPGRIFERAVQITAGARQFATTNDRAWLWVALDWNTPRVYRMVHGMEAKYRWLESTGLGSPEAPFELDGRRLRKTFYRRLDERFGGAIPSVAGINQSERVAAERYLSVTQPTEFLEGVVEDAYAEALRRVQAAPNPTVLTDHDVDRLNGDPARAAAELNVGQREAGPLLSGRRDVFACACKDFYHSPYGQPGSACPAPVWTCLFCSLAVITPAKLPTLLRLADHIDSQRGEMAADEWTTMHGAVWHQLHSNIFPRYPEAVIAAARITADAAALYLPPHETHPGPLR